MYCNVFAFIQLEPHSCWHFSVRFLAIGSLLGLRRPHVFLRRGIMSKLLTAAAAKCIWGSNRWQIQKSSQPKNGQVLNRSHCLQKQQVKAAKTLIFTSQLLLATTVGFCSNGPIMDIEAWASIALPNHLLHMSKQKEVASSYQCVFTPFKQRRET